MKDDRPSVLDALPRPQSASNIGGCLKDALDATLRGQQFTEAAKDPAIAKTAVLELAETVRELRNLLHQATDTANRVRELAAIAEGASPAIRARHGVTRTALPIGASLEDLASGWPQ